MKNILMTASAVALSAGAATAGGLDRSRLSYGILFEKGNYAEIGIMRVSPDVSGAYPAGLGGGSTGDMAGAFTGVSFGYKQQFTDKLALALLVHSPHSADANYTVGPYTGLNAKWTNAQVAAIIKYNVADNMSVYGGLRYLRSKATIAIPSSLLPFSYTAKGSTADLGYIVGAAYEKPDIALRVALTYESKIKHDFPTTETGGPLGPGFASTTSIEMPQSLALDFQSGVAKDTLVFGSIRWTEWSVWKVRPPGYGGLTGQDITGFDNDVLTYQLGVGRRLNENWSVFARASYEKANGGVASRLSPTDGSRSIGLGGTYTKDGMKVTGGLEYIMLGDAVDGSGVAFTDNTALGLGVTVGFAF